MSESNTQTTRPNPTELFPGVFDIATLEPIPESHLRTAVSNDWYTGDVAFSKELNSRFHFEYKPETTTESESEVCDLSGLFFAFDDTGFGEKYMRAINESYDMDLVTFLYHYRDPINHPNLTAAITAMNAKVAKLGEGYTQITPPVQKRREVISQVSELADELGLSLQNARLERFKNIGRIIAAASEQCTEPNNNDSGLWVSDDVYRYEAVPLGLAPLGGIAIRGAEVEPPITKMYKGKPEKGKLWFVKVEYPTVEPVVIGLDGEKYLMPRIDHAQRLPYKRYGPGEELPVTW